MLTQHSCIKMIFMRVILAILILSSLTLTFTSCKGFPEEERMLVVGDTDAVLVLPVSNAGCKNCQQIMEDNLLKEKGVKQAILNLYTKKVSVVYKPTTTSEMLKNKVKSLKAILPCK